MAKAAKKAVVKKPAPKPKAPKQAGSDAPEGMNPTVWKNLPQSEKDKLASQGQPEEITPPEVSDESA